MTAHDDIAEVRASFEKLRSAGRTSDILKVWCDDGTDALDRVEAEIARMREQRDTALVNEAVYYEERDEMWRKWKAAEAEATRMREQRDALRAKLTTPLDAPTEYDLTGREGE